jgi:hypothetical protein
VFVLTVAITALLAPWSAAARRLLAVVIAAYAATSAVAAAAAARRHGWRHIVPLLVAFATIHFSWGSGLLIGALRFAHRWTSEEPPPPQLRSALMAGRELVRTTVTEQRVVVHRDHRIREGGI